MPYTKGNCQVQITPIDSVAIFGSRDIIMAGWQIEVYRECKRSEERRVGKECT